VPPFFTGFLKRQHRNGNFPLAGSRLQARLAEHASQLKHSIQPPMTKALVSFMLHNIVIAHKRTCNSCDSSLKNRPLLLCTNSRGNLRHRHHNFRQRSLFHLHREAKFVTKGPQPTGKEPFYNILTPNDGSSLGEKPQRSHLQDHTQM
jgi:hypothetical protein